MLNESALGGVWSVGIWLYGVGAKRWRWDGPGGGGARLVCGLVCREAGVVVEPCSFGGLVFPNTGFLVWQCVEVRTLIVLSTGKSGLGYAVKNKVSQATAFDPF